MWETVGFVITVLALVVSIVAIVLTAIFYFKSARDLQHITKVIVDYLQMAMNNPDIKPNFDKKGRLINWNVTLRPSGEVKPQGK
jgi:hypothetical protein